MAKRKKKAPAYTPSKITGIDLQDKVVMLKKSDFALGDADENYLFLCRSGFGLRPKSLGRAVFGTVLAGPHAGHTMRVERYQIDSVVDNPPVTTARGKYRVTMERVTIQHCTVEIEADNKNDAMAKADALGHDFSTSECEWSDKPKEATRIGD